MKIVNILLSLFFVFVVSCNDANEPGKGSGKNPGTSKKKTYEISGFVQDGPCLPGGDVKIQMLYDSDLRQVPGELYITQTESDFGFYDASRVMRATSYQYALITVTVPCYNEVTNVIMESKTFRSLVDLDSTGDVNINPLTTLIVDRQLELYRDNQGVFYQDFDASTIQAEKELLEIYFNVFGVTDRFSEMSLDNRNGGPLLAANVILLEGKEVPKQNALMSNIIASLRDGDNTSDIIGEIKRASQAINLFEIKKNLENRYNTIGYAMSAPDFWDYIDSDGDGTLNTNDDDNSVEYYLTNGSLKIIKQIGLNESENIEKSSLAGYRYFAMPYVFDNETFVRFISVNTTGDYLSVYSNNDGGDGIDATNDQPNVALKTITKIPNYPFNDIELDDLEGNTYSKLPNSFSGDINFTFQSGVKYWIVLWSDNIYQPYVGQFAANFNQHGGRAISSDGTNWELNIDMNRHRILFTN